MTLVAAFRCSRGGILLCADREENDGYTRREVDKISRFNFVSCQVFIAGAGPSGVVTKASADIYQGLHKAEMDGADLVQSHQDVIQESLRQFHKQYAPNLKAGYLDLLIIVAPLAQSRFPMLYRTELAMMVPEGFYCACGSGRTICDYFADRLYEYGRHDKDSMKMLTAFILREAEHAAAGVGLGNDVWFIHEGDKSVHMISKGVVKELQDLIPPLEESLWADWRARVTIPPQYSG
jgi:20S proteasome alpha/beta subunit